MKHRRYRQHEWIDLRIEVRSSAVAGKGMFAQSLIGEGEVVVIWAGTVFTRSQVDAGKATKNSTMAIPEDLYLGSPVGEYNRERDDLGDFINHSCNPNCWMRDEVTLVARRDISPGDELTADYAMWEDDETHVAPWTCACVSRYCRKKITGKDWRLTNLQEQYGGHFSPFINERIAALSGPSCRSNQ